MPRRLEREPVEVLAFAPGTTSSRLRVFFDDDAPALAEVVVEEDDAQQTIAISLARRALAGTDDDGAEFADGAFLITDSLEVELASPVGIRTVIDADTGRAIAPLVEARTDPARRRALDSVSSRAPALWVL